MKKTILTIVLAVLCLFTAKTQPTVYTGKITDEQGMPVPAATISIKGTAQKISADQDGRFLIKNLSAAGTLIVSCVGYISREIPPKQRPANGNIILTADQSQLKEIEINAGYYTVKEKERTGSISRITASQIEKQPVNNVLQAMQASVAGAQISQNTGVPGGGFSVQIRGRNSIAQGNDPFYIIDGVPFTSTTLAGSRSDGIIRDASPLASINPNDIESVEILKDADATAIYGSRGANGVILITTKKGKTGKPRASFSINQGLSRVATKLDLMNTSQYLEMRTEAFANDKLSPATNQYDVNGTWGKERDIDWQKELIGGTAPSTNVQTSFSGGNETTQYQIGAAYYKEGTVFPGAQSFGRKSGNFGLQYTSENKKFHALFSANYSQTSSNLFTTDLTQYIMLPPNYPALLNSQGGLNWADDTMYQNPIAVTQRIYSAKTNNLISRAELGYTLIEGLKLKASFGYTTMNRDDYNNQPLSTTSPAQKFGTENRIAYFGNNNIETWIVEPQASYTRTIGKGRLDFLIGGTFQENVIDGQNIKGTGFNSDALLGNIAAASLLTTQERQYRQYRYTAVFSRINYSLKDRYILNATARRDGSSRFGADNKFASFGAIGGAWIMSEEKLFREKLPFISFAKLRGSYGVTGNDQITDYGYLELWNTYTNTYQGISTIIPNQIANPNYAWEINKKLEGAIDLGFLKDRFNLSTGYYSNRSSSQLVRKQLAPSTGFTSIQDNLPAKVSNTGWEFEISTKNTLTGLKWSTNINLTIPRNKLLEYPNLETSADAITYQIGQPLSILKVYNTSVDAQSGLYTVEDHDKNGTINDADRYLTEFNGRRYFGGIQNSFSYKGIQFDFLIQFVKQTGKNYLGGTFITPGSFSPNSPMVNQPAEFLDRWKQAGDNAPYQRFGTTSSTLVSFLNAVGNGSLSITDASFIRLKNVSLAYNFPSKLIEKLRLNSSKFYLQAQNLFTITKYKGLDPETQSLSNLPALQVFSAGLQFTF